MMYFSVKGVMNNLQLVLCIKKNIQLDMIDIILHIICIALILFQYFKINLFTLVSCFGNGKDISDVGCQFYEKWYFDRFANPSGDVSNQFRILKSISFFYHSHILSCKREEGN